MADQPNSLEIEDVLSSIRRLVSQDGARGAVPPAAPVAAPVAPPVAAPVAPEPVLTPEPAFSEPAFSEPTFTAPVEDLYADAPDPLEIAARLQPAPMKEEQDALVLGPALRIPEVEDYELPVEGAWAEGLSAATLEQPDLGGEHVLAAAFAAPQAPAAPEFTQDPFVGEHVAAEALSGEAFSGDPLSDDPLSGEPSLSAAEADALAIEEDNLQSWERGAAPAEEPYDPEGFFGSPLLPEPSVETAQEPEIEWVDMVSEEPAEEEFIVSSTEYPIDDPEPLTRLTAADLPSAPSYAPRQSSYEALREAEERAAMAAAEIAELPEEEALPEATERGPEQAEVLADKAAGATAGKVAGAMVAGAAMEPADLLAGLDEDYLRGLVRAVLREELQGQMGERITRNLRKLVRREIQRALAGEQFD